jgi:hypothetical protein
MLSPIEILFRSKTNSRRGLSYNGTNKEVICFISDAIYCPRSKNIAMNRKKKLTQIHKKRIKAAKAKGNAPKKSSYISKADRAKLEAMAETENDLPIPE